MRFAASTIFLLMAFLYPLQAQAVNEARESLAQIQAAIDNADSAAFEKLVDLDGIIENALDVFIAKMRDPEFAGRIPPILALALVQPAGRDKIKGLLASAGREFVLYGVGSGAFAGKKTGQAQGGGMLAPLFAQASLGRKEITDIGDPVRDGDSWLVPFTVRDDGNGNAYPVVGEIMVDNGKLANIKNMDQLFDRIAREAALGTTE